MSFDCYPYSDMQTATWTTTQTCIAAPGAGKAIVVLSLQIAGLANTILSGTTVLSTDLSTAAATVFPFHPQGWWTLGEDEALKTGANSSGTATYKIVDV